MFVCVLFYIEFILFMCFRLKWCKEIGSDICILYLSGCFGNEWELEFFNMVNIGGFIYL